MSTEPTMSLPEFFDHVAQVQDDRIARGVRRVYFQHDTLTPHNVRGVWEDVPLDAVPAVGDVLDLAGFGHDGVDGQWRVAAVAPNGPSAVLVTMTDVTA